MNGRPDVEAFPLLNVSFASARFPARQDNWLNSEQVSSMLSDLKRTLGWIMVPEFCDRRSFRRRSLSWRFKSWTGWCYEDKPSFFPDAIWVRSSGKYALGYRGVGTVLRVSSNELQTFSLGAGQNFMLFRWQRSASGDPQVWQMLRKTALLSSHLWSWRKCLVRMCILASWKIEISTG